MSKSNILSLVLLLFFITTGNAQDNYQKNESVDVKHYTFSLFLTDDSNEIKGETTVTVDFQEATENFILDLIGKSDEFGMTVTGVSENEEEVEYQHADNKIIIKVKNDQPSSKTFKVNYQGIPKRGLVISTTKFGQRSFFGDNWPNLASHWLPTVDHPYDKASIEFRITAPEQYDVVATGKKIEESNLGNGFKLTTYRESAPVAMKVATIGVTKFATKLLGMVDDIPVTAWVYPENRLDGFSDYSVAVDVLEYYIDHIGPYSYEKLANMQAKTQWGGLENAGTIAYFEDSVTGNNEVEALIAHEIAHQWFGNSVTEDNWNQVWLSEGFATYFTILYQESVYGNEKRKEELTIDKAQIIDFYKKNPSPIVDNTITDPMRVLNTNTYQKGSWVLNMLRHKLGDDVFWEGIRLYFKTYRNSNATTDDFREIMEEVSGKDLTDFFNQWIFTKGYPELKWNWKYKNGKVKVYIDQLQESKFQFPLEIGVAHDQNIEIKKVMIKKKSQVIKITVDEKPTDLIFDPESWLLFEKK